MTPVFFNLLVNSFFSLICGLIVVGFFIWLFRVDTSRGKLFLLSLPFLKIVYDVARGVPAQSVLFSGIDPYTLPGGNQTFSIGAGVSQWSVIMNAVFTVKDLNGKAYDASAGDYLVIWLTRKFGHEIPLIIVSGVLAVSTALVVIRIIQGLRFEKKRRKDRAENGIELMTIPVAKRRVDVYRTDLFSGTPFTGGVFRPYICVPADAHSKLSQQELKAVLAHELGHVRYFDLVITMSIQFLGDIFWFVPAYRWLSRKIDRLREVLADQMAVKDGNDPAVLASALLKLKEIPETHDRFILYSAFFRERSLVKERVERLLGSWTEKKPRLGWQYFWLRILVCITTAGAVINSAFGGNHKTFLMQNPDWFTHLLKLWGLQ